MGQSTSSCLLHVEVIRGEVAVVSLNPHSPFSVPMTTGGAARAPDLSCSPLTCSLPLIYSSMILSSGKWPLALSGSRLGAQVS